MTGTTVVPVCLLYCMYYIVLYLYCMYCMYLNPTHRVAKKNDLQRKAILCGVIPRSPGKIKNISDRNTFYN